MDKRISFAQEAPTAPPPAVLVKHRWNPIRVTDVYEMAKAVALLFSRGEGAIEAKLEKAWVMMGCDPSELAEE